MDPTACLKRAWEAIQAGDDDEAAAALADYRDWRRGGGFEPTVGFLPGDAVAAMLHVYRGP